jgi:hypothetical protein
VYGLTDGLLDLVAKPVQEYKRKGDVGLATGFAKALGNVVCKPIAGKWIDNSWKFQR